MNANNVVRCFKPNIVIDITRKMTIGSMKFYINVEPIVGKDMLFEKNVSKLLMNKDINYDIHLKRAYFKVHTSATCKEEDEFDEMKGFNIVYNRLYAKMNYRVLKFIEQINIAVANASNSHVRDIIRNEVRNNYIEQLLILNEYEH